jgi:hypothetical protein
MTTPEQQAGGVIRPFTVEIPEDALDDLRRRRAATRWPSSPAPSDHGDPPRARPVLDGRSLRNLTTIPS